MNKSIIITLIAILSCTAITPSTAQKNADRDQYSIRVDGLGCPFCAYGLEKKFKKFKGLKELRLDLETGIFTFSYPADDPLSTMEVEAQVDAAGYTSIETTITRADGTIDRSKVEASDKIIAENVVKTVLPVGGQCNMCYARIRKAAFGVEGVAEAEWDEDSGLLDLRYDKTLTTPDVVAKAIATAGHDTEVYKAEDSTYDNLPSCCHYKRIKS
ncbi:MAG: heavy-metal-associated domain-containing protein [Bacteroidota bacterium]